MKSTPRTFVLLFVLLFILLFILLRVVSGRKDVVILQEPDFESEWREPSVQESIAIGVSLRGRSCGAMKVRPAPRMEGRFLVQCGENQVYRITGPGSTATGPWSTVAAALTGDLGQVIPRAARVASAARAPGAVASRPTESPTKPNLSRKEANEAMALIINLNGMLCAEVVGVRPLKIPDRYEVECTEYRGGQHSATYVVDARQGAAERL